MKAGISYWLCNTAAGIAGKTVGPCAQIKFGGDFVSLTGVILLHTCDL